MLMRCTDAYEKIKGSTVGRHNIANLAFISQIEVVRMTTRTLNLIGRAWWMCLFREILLIAARASMPERVH